MSGNIADDLRKCLGGAMKEWTKQRKAEKRDERAYRNRRHMYSSRVPFTDVAARIFPVAYQHASGNGSLPVAKRQMYYAARDKFLKATGRVITQARCNTVLLQFINQNPAITKDWRITADPRGALFIPNTYEETRIPCGTLDIDKHLLRIQHEHIASRSPPSVPYEWPSLAPGQRYRAVLYIEKEGFEPLMRQARIAERFEIAVLSCKGQSVVAARKFVDRVCGVNNGVPLFVVHDFDVHGFFIGARLTSVSEQAEEQDRVAYRFENEINMTDLGLRLVDAEKYSLVDEECKPPERIHNGLGCTDDEKAFLMSGRRIELNAFSSPQFIEWLEGKLRGAGITERMVPDDHTLEQAFRHTIVTARTNRTIQRIHRKATEEATAARLPKRLAEMLRRVMARHDEPWDMAMRRIVSRRMRKS